MNKVKKFLAGCLFVNVVGSSLPVGASANYYDGSVRYCDSDYDCVYAQDFVVDNNVGCSDKADKDETDKVEKVENSRGLIGRVAHGLLDLGMWAVNKSIWILGFCSFASKVRNYKETYGDIKGKIDEVKKDFVKYEEVCTCVDKPGNGWSNKGEVPCNEDARKNTCSSYARDAFEKFNDENRGLLSKFSDGCVIGVDYIYHKGKKKVGELLSDGENWVVKLLTSDRNGNGQR